MGFAGFVKGCREGVGSIPYTGRYSRQSRPVEERSVRRVLVTGAEGVIGSAVRCHLADRYELVSLTRTSEGFPSVVADIACLEQVEPAFEGVDAVVHLAAAVSVDSSWDDVLRDNIAGTRNVFEAARRAGAGTVVYASSNHAVGSLGARARPGPLCAGRSAEARRARGAAAGLALRSVEGLRRGARSLLRGNVPDEGRLPAHRHRAG